MCDVNEEEKAGAKIARRRRGSVQGGVTVTVLYSRNGCRSKEVRDGFWTGCIELSKEPQEQLGDSNST